VTPERIRIGTRRSRLALWQTEWVAAAVRRQHPAVAVEVVPIQTLGDRDKATSLVGLGQVGVFTKEIEEALLDGRCDVAVHSFKDLATQLPEGLVLGAVPERADPRDALVSRAGQSLDELPPGSLIGTSSLRRRALILHRRPDLRVTGLRGNVPTRLRAAGVDLDEGKQPVGEPIDGTVMALAGLARLGLERHATEVLAAAAFPPAPAQGAIAIEIRADDRATAGLLEPIDHRPTRLATAAERTFLAEMEGGCHVPLGALASVEGGEVRLAGIVVDLDGERSVFGASSGRDPREVGLRLARDLRRQGADAILERVAAANAQEAGSR
jgi:hydroxymethylbilane synthase